MAEHSKQKPRKGEASSGRFNILVIGQAGRLQYEAVLLAASLKSAMPNFAGKLFVGVPENSPKWHRDPAIKSDTVLSILKELGAEILPFESAVFGSRYPNGNKIEALPAMPKGEPFLFLDTDTLILDDLGKVPFDFDRPSASMKREATWPKIELYGPGYNATWKSLYDRFGLDFESSLDLGFPDEYWQRYLYFNAGYFYFRCPREFGARYLEYAREIYHDRPEELVCQELDPWLDQVALPLVIHSFGGGRVPEVSNRMDGEVTCHWRVLPLLYARENDRVVEVLEEVSAPNRIKKVLKEYDPFKRMIYQGRGHKVRALFDRDNLPRREQAIRNQIKRNGFWMR